MFFGFSIFAFEVVAVNCPNYDENIHDWTVGVNLLIRLYVVSQQLHEKETITQSWL